MSFESDWKDVPEEKGGGEFSLVPEGTYTAILFDCKLDMTKDPVRLTFVYEISEGEHKKRKLFGNYQLKGKGIGFMKKDLKSLGIDYSTVSKPEDIADLMWNSLPMTVEVYVKHNEFNGKTYANVYLNGKLTRVPNLADLGGNSTFDDAQGVPF